MLLILSGIAAIITVAAFCLATEALSGDVIEITELGYQICCAYDPQVGAWYVADSQVPGLVAEAESLFALRLKVRERIPELLELNQPNQER